MGLPLGFTSWGCLGGLGFSPLRARCGSGAAAWVSGVLAAPDTQGGWQLEQQEISCSRRVWQPVLANTLQYSCLENPFSDREAWQETVYRVTKSQTGPQWPCVHKHMFFFFFFCLFQLCPSESWTWRWCSCLTCRDSGSAKCSGAQTASLAGVIALSESFFELLVAGDQKASLASLSIALPIQTLKGIPCLGFFSVVQHIRHIEGAPWLGSNSVDWWISHLKEHPGWGPNL